MISVNKLEVLLFSRLNVNRKPVLCDHFSMRVEDGVDEDIGSESD